MRAIAAILVLTAGLAAVLYKVLPSPQPAPTNVAVVMPEPAPTDATSADASTTRAGDALSLHESLRGGGTHRELDRAGAGGVAGGVAETIDVSHPAFLVIDTPDPAAASDQVQQYLAQNKISWQPMPVQTAVRDRAALQQFGVNRLAPAEEQSQPLAAPAPTTAPFMNGSPTTFPGSDPSQFADVNSPSNIAGEKNNPTTNNFERNLFANGSAPQAGSGASDTVIVAQMSREQAVQLNAAISQPIAQQSAQIVWPAETDATANLRKESSDQERSRLVTSIASAKAQASDDRALEAGETIRVCATPTDSQLAGAAPVDATLTIDADGSLAVPTVGRISAAGATPKQLAEETLPQSFDRAAGMMKSPTLKLSWTVERVRPLAVGDAGMPKDKSELAFESKLGASTNTPTTGPSTEPTIAPTLVPTTAPTQSAAQSIVPGTQPAELAARADDAKHDLHMNDQVCVVILMRANDAAPTTAPANVTEMPATAPTTQPEPTSTPSTLPDR